jgi:uncharacterized MAPEG superfamily protein
MSADLFYLTLSAGLCIILWAPYIISRVLTWGLLDAVGYPDNPPDLPKWAQRSQRAHLNMVENLAPFAALVLVAHVMGVANSTTALGAALFFYARIVQVIVHILGIPWLRTLAFVVGIVGMLLIFYQILSVSPAG